MINWNKKTNIEYKHKGKVIYSYDLYLDEESVEKANNYLLNNVIRLIDIYETYQTENTKTIKISKSKFDRNSEDGYIYTITNILNNKKYIGRTINAISRIMEHIKKSSSDELIEDIIKYGLINFTVKVELFNNYKQKEKDMITENGLENLYNKI